jgi:hypothetical protein
MLDLLWPSDAGAGGLDSGDWLRLEWKFVNLLEILRLFAEKYCHLATHAQTVATYARLSESSPKHKILAEEVSATMVATLIEMRKDIEKLDLRATRDAINWALRRWEEYHNPELLGNLCTHILLALDSDFKAKVCFVLPRESQRFYEAPTEGWEKILEAFPDARQDVEQMRRCLAFNCYPAAVFHVLLVVEASLIELGKLVGVTDPKTGWDATCKQVERILAAGYKAASPDIQPHFKFLEQINASMQSIKLAWRNKVNHAAGRLFLQTSDMQETTAEKIINACHGFMLVLATEGPMANGPALQ